MNVKRLQLLLVLVLMAPITALADWEADFDGGDIDLMADYYSFGDLGNLTDFDTYAGGGGAASLPTESLPPFQVWGQRVQVAAAVTFLPNRLRFTFSNATIVSGQSATNDELYSAIRIACQLSVSSTYDTWLQSYQTKTTAFKNKIDSLVALENEGMQAQLDSANAWVQQNAPVTLGLAHILGAMWLLNAQGTLSEGPGALIKGAADAKLFADSLLLADWKADANTACATYGHFEAPPGV